MSSIVEKMSAALDTRAATVNEWTARYRGESQFVLLTQEQRDALKNRLSSLSINYGALAVDLLNERLRLIGFTIDGTPDLNLWERWADVGMLDGAQQVQRDALATGQGFVSVWADEDGEPIALPESASQCIVKRDPVSRRVVVGFKRWQADGYGHAALYLPDQIQILKSQSHVPEGGYTAPNGWQTTSTIPNPLGRVPLLDVTNLGSVQDVYGVSELEGLRDLTDALQKVMVDAMLSSHETGTARRWATGLGTIQTDEDGAAEDPWADGTATVQHESPDAKFGQFSPADLAGFDTLAGLIVRQIGALSGLSPQMLGLHADSAMSADAIRAAEASLVAKAEARQRTFGRAWAQVAALLLAIRDGGDPKRFKVMPVWSDPATRSEAQAADAAVKLRQAGILSTQGTLERLGMSPREIAQEQQRAAADMAMQVASGQVSP
ncbi:phage portal protein [Nocardioides jensenii]|uniref:phage portal protein n=1 Tax=Nocardioides jensenii TaxID=1843 RepID=UPI00082F9047|nr:phage portal protein [Nocardioides jensenii]